jgi:hypothetical protein
MSLRFSVSQIFYVCVFLPSMLVRAEEPGAAVKGDIQTTYACSAKAGLAHTIPLALPDGPIHVVGKVRPTAFRTETEWRPSASVVIGDVKKAATGVQLGYWDTTLLLSLLSFDKGRLADRQVKITKSPMPFRLDFDKQGEGTVRIGSIQSKTTIQLVPQRELILACSSGDFVFEDLHIYQ